MNIEKEREAFEKSYAEMLIGGELKGLESVIFAKYLESGEYAQDKVDTAWCMWQAAKAQAVPEGFVLVPKEPSADLVNHGHQVFLGHFNEGGQTGGRSLYFAYKAMLEAVEQNQ